MSLLRNRAAPERGSISRFLLSPLFTGLLLPAFLLAAGTMTYFLELRRHQLETGKLRDELRVLQEEKQSLENHLHVLERETHSSAAPGK